MAEFINTIDVLGDDAVIDSIINRTITELKDDTLTTIGGRAFQGCSDLETIVLPNVETLGGCAFQNCTSLKEITAETFPKVTRHSGYLGVGSGIFTGCTGLESVVWPSLEVEENVDLFKGCTSLKSADLPNLTTIDKYGTGIFNGCAGLESVNLPKLTKVLAEFFRDCKALKNITLPCVIAIEGGSSLREVGCTLIDLPVCTSITGAYAIGYTSALKCLILRSPVVCTLGRTDCFNNNTNILNGTAHIYVPRALVNSYKAATNWSAYATQFRALEDYTVDGTITGELDETKI